MVKQQPRNKSQLPGKQLELFPIIRRNVRAGSYRVVVKKAVSRKEIDLDKLTFALLHVTDQLRLGEERGRLIAVLRHRVNALRRSDG